MQGCQVHVVGAAGGEAWGRDLPGLASAPRVGEGGSKGEGKGEGGAEVDKERMKIAWRYEGLGKERERGAWKPFVDTQRMDKLLLLAEVAFPLRSYFL